MQERPEKWQDPEFYRERSLRTFKLYKGRHWCISGYKRRESNRKRVPIYKLTPELEQWLESYNFPHSVRIKNGGRSKIIFERKEHAMLFKLAWT